MLLFLEMTFVKLCIFSWILVNTQWRQVSGEAVVLTAKNIDMTLASNELVFINFYAEWCRFSNILAPVFDKAADEVREAFPNASGVVMGKVDCEKERSLATRFSISKYPTLKIIRNGQFSKREYRGQRSSEAFVEFVKKELADPIKEFQDIKEVKTLDEKKRTIIGYFDKKDVAEYQMFRRVATNLKEDCQFLVGFGGASKEMHPPSEPLIVFRSDKAVSNEEHEKYSGKFNNFDELYIWAQEKCIPLVREITFENAEELTEEGLPFLILFHAPEDGESIKTYKKVITEMLLDEKQNAMFLTADGHKFAHPLHHLGKSSSDLPLIAIDSFKHMYLFPDFKDITVPGKLKDFLKDLYSGKLHREFHYGPDQTTQDMLQIGGDHKSPTTPPESTFKKLMPSKNRYTLLRDEL